MVFKHLIFQMKLIFFRFALDDFINALIVDSQWDSAVVVLIKQQITYIFSALSALFKIDLFCSRY